MIYFTSDLHFHHKNIIRHAQRPFENTEDMNATLIENWNHRVRPKDEVYILGDLTLCGPDQAMEILRLLNGRKYLVRGNHDLFLDKPKFDQSLFAWVKDYHRLVYNDKHIVLFHYPIEEWDRYHWGAIHLHGHQHGKREDNIDNLRRGIRRYDVGVDANGMSPISIDEILAWFSMSEYSEQDDRKEQTELNYYMALPYRIEIIPDHVEGGFTLGCPDLPGCVTCADTIEQGLALLEDAKHCWFTACLEDGIEIPEPQTTK